MFWVNRKLTKGRQHAATALGGALMVLTFVAWMGLDQGHQSIGPAIAGLFLGVASRKFIWRSRFEAWTGHIREWLDRAWKTFGLLVALVATVGAVILLPGWWELMFVPMTMVAGWYLGYGSEGLSSEEWYKREQRAKLIARTPPKYKGLG